jgi:hypothetical protein
MSVCLQWRRGVEAGCSGVSSPLTLVGKLTSAPLFEATKRNTVGKGWNHCPPCWQESAQLLPFHRLRSPVALLSVTQERLAQMMAVCRMMRRWMTVLPKMGSLVRHEPRVWKDNLTPADDALAAALSRS